MIAAVVANLLLVVTALVLPNEVLVWNSWILYGAQTLTIGGYLIARSVAMKNLFIPTTFALAYYLVDLTLGSYLVPRDIGWNKAYVAVAQQIDVYHIVVPYLLLANLLLFVLSCRTLASLASRSSTPDPHNGRRVSIASTLGWMVGFLVLSYLDVYSVFSFQLAILICQLGELSRRRSRWRFPLYLFYLVVLTAFSYENKREIAMVLFLMVFLETYHGRYRLRPNLRTVAIAVMAAASFLAFILTASVMRGYGGLNVTSALGAVEAVPRYVGSDIFLDGLTDNLELNYTYGSAITSIDLVLNGTIPYQFGASLWKPAFLPIPRRIFPWKPNSVMTVYTQAFDPGLAAEEGSLPVLFPSEMFVNFGLLGLLPLVLVWMAINTSFVRLHTSVPGSFGHLSATFLSITVLILARGGGLDLYLVNYLVGAPLLWLVAANKPRLAQRAAPPSLPPQALAS